MSIVGDIHEERIDAIRAQLEREIKDANRASALGRLAGNNDFSAYYKGIARGLTTALRLLPLVLVLLCGCVRPGQGWQPHATVLAGVYAASALVDEQQTEYITRECTEANTIIGRCGEGVSPRVFFPVIVGLTVGAASVLREPYRTILLAAQASASVHANVWNWQAGYTLRW